MRRASFAAILRTKKRLAHSISVLPKMPFYALAWSSGERCDPLSNNAWNKAKVGTSWQKNQGYHILLSPITEPSKTWLHGLKDICELNLNEKSRNPRHSLREETTSLVH